METLNRFLCGLERLVNIITGIALAAVLLYAGYALWDNLRVYNAAGISGEIMHYKPTVEKNSTNPTLPELQAINPDVCAWLTLDDTDIDYPILQGENNAEYLNCDIYKKYSLGGSVFLDCHNNRDFTDRYSLIYGHHMDGGTMFGDIAKFDDETYFYGHQTGWLFVPGKTYKLEIYAFLHEDAYLSPMFDVQLNAEGYANRLSYIRNSAVHYRDIGADTEDQILALSTCSSATTNGRSIVVARMAGYTETGGEQETK